MDTLIEELVKLGIPRDLAREQVKRLSSGTVYAPLLRSASIGDGLLRLSSDEVSHAVERYDNRSNKVKVLKFVPASGAATRMFKDLRAYVDTGELGSQAAFLLAQRDKLPFASRLPKGLSDRETAAYIIEAHGLGLAQKPKGSIPFHSYIDASRTAFEEHLVEGATYAQSDQQVHIHFTISENHSEEVISQMQDWQQRYAEQLGCEFELGFSTQRSSTDTMAQHRDGRPARLADGQLLLRPGGHGALIYNLNALDADIVFIKNIDNVVAEEHRAETLMYKKALAGMLMQIRQEARAIIQQLERGEDPVDARAFLINLGTKVPEYCSTELLLAYLNRPYRVCGMVKNEGEPGGGPFWIEKDGHEYLQIVESAQIDMANLAHVEMLNRGTHFNPVDLVCSLKDLAGNPLDLEKHVDMDTAFVSQKVVNGDELNVMEWPGLWNGAMADWNSLFVEVPISTFNPVKTINDLLRPMHQPGN